MLLQGHRTRADFIMGRQLGRALQAVGVMLVVVAYTASVARLLGMN